MGKLMYSMISSLDGYVADRAGTFGWAEPDEAVHSFVNDLERSVGTYLYGRRMYEVMAAWETMDTVPDQPPHIRDFTKIWLAADKIVYSKTLSEVLTAKTRLERDLDPEAVRRLKLDSPKDLSIGGPHIAAQAIGAGLVDEYHFFLAPIEVGGGNRFLPDDVRVDLELLDERRFPNGMVYLRYRTGIGDR